jgi:hypothetical protein
MKLTSSGGFVSRFNLLFVAYSASYEYFTQKVKSFFAGCFVLKTYKRRSQDLSERELIFPKSEFFEQNKMEDYSCSFSAVDFEGG